MPRDIICTDADIAQMFGISPCRVYQIRQRALLKIRKAILADPQIIEFVREHININVLTPNTQQET